MQVNVKLQGIDFVVANLGKHARQIPFATKQALYATALQVKKETYTAMLSAFDRPTPQTMKSLFIKAGKTSATVYVKDRNQGKNTAGVPDIVSGMAEQGSMAQIIGHQWSGGQRVKKKIEQAFAKYGLIKSSEYLAPGPNARLDQYGNMSRGQVQQIYTALRLHLDPTSNYTDSKRSIRNAKAAGRMFWSDGSERFNLRRGLWGVDGRGRPQLILVVIPKATYKRRIFMDVIAERVVARDWQQNFSEAMAKAIATAR